MLARLQQVWVALLIGAAALCGGAMLASGYPWWLASVSALAVLHVHAGVLALQFTALSRIDPGPGIPVPTDAALFAAWWREACTGLQVFCWRQPFRSNALPNRLERSASGKRGIVLIHGFVCNRGLWNPWMRRLQAIDVPFIAINLEPVFGSIDEYAQTIDDAVAELTALTGHPPVVVAHSMGGLAVRAWLRDRQSDERIHSVITIGTPHEGTWMARFALTANTRQMRRSSPWLQALATHETPRRRALFTCFFGHCDNIVMPACTAKLPGADNRHVPGVAHIRMAFQPAVYDEVLKRL